MFVSMVVLGMVFSCVDFRINSSCCPKGVAKRFRMFRACGAVPLFVRQALGLFWKTDV